MFVLGQKTENIEHKKLSFLIYAIFNGVFTVYYYFFVLQDAQKVWQKPGVRSRVMEPQHKVPVHPGADDDTDSEEEIERVKSTNVEMDSDNEGSDHSYERDD